MIKIKKINQTIIVFISIFVLATIPIIFAAVQTWVWNIYCFFTIAAFIAFLWEKKPDSEYISFIWTNKTLFIFFIWAIILCLPLPVFIISFISPARFKLITTATDITEFAPAWQTISYSSMNAFAWWVFLISLWLFFFVIRYICSNRKTLKTILFIMIGIGTLEAVYGIIQALVPSMGVLWVDYVHDYMGNARGTFINRNHFAGFIEMIWPLVLGYTMALNCPGHTLKKAFSTDMLNRQALMALNIVVLLLALLLSRSRAGITGGAIGFITFWFMARPKIKSIALHSRLLLFGIVVVLGIYCFTIGVIPIFERFLQIEDGNSRIDIWRDSLSILKDHPIGIGLKNYENVFQVYNQSFYGEKTVLYAHNDYLQLLIETGWIGFSFLIGGFLLFIRKKYRIIKRLDVEHDPTRFFIAVGAFSGIISLVFHSFFDFNLQIPANCLYFVALMAILSSCTEHAKNSQSLQSTNNDLAEYNQTGSISTTRKRIYN
jgi:O-antigen ligase